VSISYYAQQNVLPAIKSDRPEFVELGSHALQQTLRRLDLAFQAFFRRVKAGQTPGFPRFKSATGGSTLVRLWACLHNRCSK
jgi:putative transposase